tara:strand:+ start:4010 stop:4312 length:303 start_codon:yes stop_codon:yes gene_type:complete
MPVYEYYCESCDHHFEELLGVSKRDKPIKEPCPNCEEKTVKKGVSITVMGADATLTLENKCPGFTKKMEQIAKGPTINRAAKRNIEAAASMRPHGHLRPH